VYEIKRQVLPTAPSPTTTHLSKRNQRVSSLLIRGEEQLIRLEKGWRTGGQVFGEGIKIWRELGREDVLDSCYNHFEN